MHGIIFYELSKYANTRLGPTAWPRLLNDAGFPSKVFLPTQAYPDEEAVKILAAACKATGKPLDAILEDFGEFVAPSLLSMARSLIRPEWKTLDLLEHTEDTIHKMVRGTNPGANPAQLKANRRNPTEMLLSYRSQRKLCKVARGIVKGVATHFKERITISETTCISKGAPACEFLIRVTS